MAQSNRLDVAFAARATLGEGPVWDAARKCLWFVDIKQKLLHRFDPATDEHAAWHAPEQIGWVLPAEDGRLVAGLKGGLYLFDPYRGMFEFFRAVPGEPGHNRLNDACTDPAGRIWFGSMDDDEQRPTGRFYRFDRGDIVPVGPDGICITNGPAISPDGDRIYFTDTLAQTIVTASIDAQGNVGATQPFLHIASDGGHPDGPITDAERCVWTGLFGGGAVERYSPDGKRIDRIEIPAANCTKAAFGGPHLSTLYITTARKGLDEAALAAQPDAGALFTIETTIKGVAATPVKLG
ncbi:SMP-30/gluconolactonase/LRE family protein [Stakelama marina]|uniref:SMP-30/gluconolactonase/LRE family protein n=1 Tax=Stakelama marina TaxID=2826939 RepID=A0A8T4IFA3_9SPHN|nr:SMP-30/gluconolactonase/LRE family protein [Stakelama marina]MBR0552534.1 SMP-30/gluconolactonase/LRE family protein [Stakelama marina]